MILRLKGLDFEQKFADPNKRDTKKWEEFKQKTQGRLKLPVLIHEGFEPLEDADTIEEYLEKTFPDPNLKSKDKEANLAGRDLYSKFALFMRNSTSDNDDKLRAGVIRELEKLDNFLADSRKSPGVFLDGDSLKLPDCNLLPKLMHVREAGKMKALELKDFEAVKKYLEAASKESAFQDIFTDAVKKDIQEGWKKKMGNSLSNSRR